MQLETVPEEESLLEDWVETGLLEPVSRLGMGSCLTALWSPVSMGAELSWILGTLLVPGPQIHTLAFSFPCSCLQLSPDLGMLPSPKVYHVPIPGLPVSSSLTEGILFSQGQLG